MKVENDETSRPTYVHWHNDGSFLRMEKPILFNPIDPKDPHSIMQYFPRISPNSLKISPKFRATIHIQHLTYTHLFIKTISFLLHWIGHFISFNLIYWTPIYAINSFWMVLLWKNVEKYGKMAILPGGYNRIGEIPHGHLWLNWRLKG